MTSELEQIISENRLGTYLRATSFDPARALALYAWNMKISSSFMPLFSAAEICLRNRISSKLVHQYGQHWWNSKYFLELAGPETKGKIKRAENSVLQNGHQPDNGRMVAELTFGFWDNMLLPKYASDIWTPLHACFPDLPSHLDLTGLREKCGRVKDLRNRISHHEPIFGRDISQDYSSCLEFISWLSKAKAEWIKPHCSVMVLMRQKP